MARLVQAPYLVWCLTLLSRSHAAFVDCPPIKGVRGMCPAGNTCCPVLSASINNRNRTHDASRINEHEKIMGCISSDLGKYNATCCLDSLTGCGVGYACRDGNLEQDEGNDHEHDHKGTISGDNIRQQRFRFDCVNGSNEDPLVKVLPRYRLCHVPPNDTILHSFHVQENAYLGYYSSHGPLLPNGKMFKTRGSSNKQQSDTTTNSSLPQLVNDVGEIRIVIIVIHGASRNADDYFCSLMAAREVAIESWSKQQKRRRQQNGSLPSLTRENIAVVAPQIFASSDTRPPPTAGNVPDDSEDPSFLYWSDENDKNGPWRYGADATGPKPISSFLAMDRLIQSLWELSSSSSSLLSMPSLERIVVIGHSSGGQFVQRWSLLTPAWRSTSMISPPIRMHSIVANPSSYVYLTAWREHQNSGKKSTSAAGGSSCPHYNQWEWGLDDGGPLSSLSTYRNKIFQQHNQSFLVQRYLYERRVIYLIGDLDRCNVTASGGGATNSVNTPTSTKTMKASKQRTISNTSSLIPHWCDSHGLETTCMDLLQGSNRFERNARYMASLDGMATALGHRHLHTRTVIPKVGHDHSLMFQSQSAIRALFEDILYKPKTSVE